MKFDHDIYISAAFDKDQLVNKDETEYSLIHKDRFGNPLYSNDTSGHPMKIIKEIKTKSWDKAKKVYNKYLDEEK